MRILYVSQYFPPEMGAPSARVHEMSRAWTWLGHPVTVLTAFAHHPLMTLTLGPAVQGFHRFPMNHHPRRSSYLPKSRGSGPKSGSNPKGLQLTLGKGFLTGVRP